MIQSSMENLLDPERKNPKNSSHTGRWWVVCLPQLKDLEILSYGQFGSEDGRAAKMDFSDCVVGPTPDGEYTGNDIPKDLIDFGLIAKLFPNLSHLELKISRATLGITEGTSFSKLASLRLVGGNIQKATKITDAVKMCPNLQALDLKGSFIPRDELSSLARSCLQIEVLDLSFVGFNCDIFPALKIVAENIPQLKVLIILGSVYPLSNHDDEFDNSKTNNSSLAPKYGALALLKKFSCLKSFLGADEQWMGVDGYLETSLSFVGVGLTMIATMQSFPAQYSTSVEHRTYKRDQKGEWIPIVEGTDHWHEVWGSRYTCLPETKPTADILSPLDDIDGDSEDKPHYVDVPQFDLV